MKHKSVGKKLILALSVAIVASGLWSPISAAHSEDLDEELPGLPDNLDDAFIAPDMPSTVAMALASGDSIRPGYYQTSAYMAGSVTVGIILMESDGSVDPSTEDWTVDERQQVFEEIVAALDWWTAQEPRARLRFVYDDHFSMPLPTGVEPISRPYQDQQLWITDAMSALGYQADSYFTRVRDYNNDLRATYQTDWAFTIFVVDSSADRDSQFSNGYFAYAYLGGPFMVMTYGNGGYGPDNMDAVAIHEIGHIFCALDQYYSARQPCGRRSGYLDVENQNSEYGDCASDVQSIMRAPMAYTIDLYAAGQIGWRDSDGDDILDPLDTALPITITSLSLEGGSVVVEGAAEIVPYPSPNQASVTINTLIGVQYRFDEGEWQAAMADDGAFDGTAERYRFAASPSPGRRQLEVAAVDSAGNVSDVYAVATVTILDPIDGGLNTEMPRSTEAFAGEAILVDGVAYHLEDSVVVGAEYRIDGGPWQPATALDGVYDSGYEPFTLAIDSLEAGAYLIEARAMDADGHVEVNYASQELVIAQRRTTIFLPIVVSGT
jgi:hypothetical protein